MSRLRVAFVTTHPIQYQAPLFRELAANDEVELHVLYCHQATPAEQAAAGFGTSFQWDIPLLDGYSHEFLENAAKQPSIHSFAGMDTPSLYSKIAPTRFDAVVVHGWHYKSAWQAVRACRQAGVPVLVRSDSHLKTSRSLAKRIAKWPVYRWAIPRFDACLPVGQWSRAYFLHFGAQPSRVFTVPHSVDSARLSQQAVGLADQRQAIRDRWRVGQDQILWLFAGKFIDRKRPLDFVRALQRARGYGVQVSGLMAGDGPLRGQCERFTAENGLPITFSGFLNQSEIVSAYVAADGLVLPSDGEETWGLVVDEAMVCARPCIVSDQVGCGPDLVEEGVTGDIFPIGDIESLAALLRRYSAPQIARRMGEQARRKIDGHSPGRSARSLLSAVRQTVSETGHRPVMLSERRAMTIAVVATSNNDDSNSRENTWKPIA